MSNVLLVRTRGVGIDLPITGLLEINFKVSNMVEAKVSRAEMANVIRNKKHFHLAMMKVSLI